MPYRTTPFVTGNFYHIFNRGVEKRLIFLNESDFQHFLQTIYYYQFIGPKPKFSTYKRFRNQRFDENPKLIEIICYCLMPNHFHLLIKQIKEGGIHEFMSKVTNSYTKYFNTKYKRVGPLFQGQFKAVPVMSDEQLIHLSRYIHLNPYVSGLTKNLEDYQYSSFNEFKLGMEQLCSINEILSLFKDKEDYLEFIKNQQSYALEISNIKHLCIDED